MPQLSTFHSQLSPSPAALPHNPALSVWLSVDPLSDKYPGSSPYVYCANNPVRLVDKDGRTWETTEDEFYAQYLISQAKQLQKTYEIGSEEYDMLQEGTDGLTYMGECEHACFTFSEAACIDDIPQGVAVSGNVTRDEKGTIHINYLFSEGNAEVKNGTSWHECIHLTRFLKQNTSYQLWEGLQLPLPSAPNYGYKLQNVLGALPGDPCRYDEELRAFSSQFTFSPSSITMTLGIGKEDIPKYIYEHYNISN